MRYEARFEGVTEQRAGSFQKSDLTHRIFYLGCCKDLTIEGW